MLDKRWPPIFAALGGGAMAIGGMGIYFQGAQTIVATGSYSECVGDCIGLSNTGYALERLGFFLAVLGCFVAIASCIVVVWLWARQRQRRLARTLWVSAILGLGGLALLCMGWLMMSPYLFPGFFPPACGVTSAGTTPPSIPFGCYAGAFLSEVGVLFAVIGAPVGGALAFRRSRGRPVHS